MQVGGISFQPYGLAPATFNIFGGTELTGSPVATLRPNQQFIFQPQNSSPSQHHSSEEFEDMDIDNFLVSALKGMGMPPVATLYRNEESPLEPHTSVEFEDMDID